MHARSFCLLVRVCVHLCVFIGLSMNNKNIYCNIKISHDANRKKRGNYHLARLSNIISLSMSFSLFHFHSSFLLILLQTSILSTLRCVACFS